MKMTGSGKTYLTRYLLGELSPAEQEQLESAFFADDELFSELVEAETDLIDAFGRGELPLEMKTRFESRLLAQETVRERLASARALQQYIAQQKVNQVRQIALAPRTIQWIKTYSLRWAAAAACTIVLALGAWFLRNSIAQRHTISRLELENQTLRSRLSKTNPAGQPPIGVFFPHSERVVALLTLAGTPSRSMGTQSTVFVSPDVSSIRIRLLLNARRESKIYSVSLETADGATVWRNASAQSQAGPGNVSVLVIDLPSPLFAPGDYIVRVSANMAGKPLQDVDYYSFRLLN